MDRSYFIKAETKWLLLQFLLVSVVQYEARSVHCPSTCACENDILGYMYYNTANCTIGNSIVAITWFHKPKYVLLKLICTDEVENYKHDCNNLPQFDISIDKTSLVIQGCAPSIIKCAHKMFTPSTTITYFNAEMIVGTLTANDLTNLDHVSRMNIHLKEGGTEMQAVDLNVLKSIESFIMEGGNLRLFSNTLKLPKLETLVLEQNNILLPPNAFNGLPKLKSLNILSNTFEHLDTDILKGLDSLEDILFVNNSLITIDLVAFSATKQLDNLLIINNRLKLVPNGLFAGLDKLNQISITRNLVEMTLDTHAFANLPSRVRRVEVAVCNIKYLPEYVFNGSANIDELSLYGNQIESLPPKIFTTTTRLLYVDLSRNRIQNLPDGIFSELKELLSIDLSHNQLTVLKGDIFTYNKELRLVNLNNNRLTTINRDTFKGMNLRSLDLASNKLHRITSNAPLEWQTKELSLNDNELSVFEDWVMELVGLKKLNLSGNKIKMIKASEIYKFKGKAYIDLRKNNISEIVQDTSVPRVNITAADIRLRLSNNPLRCDGITTLLKEWHERGILLDYEDVSCDNGEKLSQSLWN